MAPREDFILFLDTETTGSDEKYDNLIEIGLSLVSVDEGYPEVASFSSIIYPSDSAFTRMMNKDVVREMHEKNGLLPEIVALRSNWENHEEIAPYTLGGVQQRISMWLDHATPIAGDTTHIPMGGSGILHFDRRFLDKYLPLFARRLTFWGYDVGVLRRTFRKAGVEFYSDEAKTHRALDDARVHADEWRYYERVIGGLKRGQ